MKKVKKLQIQQLDEKLGRFVDFPEPPQKGWIHSTRTAMNMTLAQMAARMGNAAPNAFILERRERDGTISVKTLQKAADALNMKLVYGFIPKEGSFERMIEAQALNTARKIVLRTNATMRLEDQQVSKDRLEVAIKELAAEIKEELPRYLWD